VQGTHVLVQLAQRRLNFRVRVVPAKGRWHHGVRWSNHTYVAPALFSLLATCVVFWSHRRREIVYTAVMFSPESMYITLDSSACTSSPSLKRHKCILQFGKATGLHELSLFLLWN
jgi:hypothetical protein